MSRREKTLAAVVLALALIWGGSVGARAWMAWWRTQHSGRENVAARIEALQELLGERGAWEQRHEWMEQTAPSYASRQEASAKLLELVEARAAAGGLTLEGKTFVQADAGAGKALPSGNAVEAAAPVFQSVAVRVGATGSEQEVLKWIHSLQQPGEFVGVTDLTLTPEPEASALKSEVEVTLYYR